MKKIIEPKFTKGQFVTLTNDTRHEMEITGFNWNGFTQMVSFKNEDLRCGQEYCRLAYFAKYIDGVLCICTHNVNPGNTYHADGEWKIAPDNYLRSEDDFKVIGQIKNPETIAEGEVFAETELHQHGNLYGLPTTRIDTKPGTMVTVKSRMTDLNQVIEILDNGN